MSEEIKWRERTFTRVLDNSTLGSCDLCGAVVEVPNFGVHVWWHVDLRELQNTGS